jgi:hypothetical protein
MIVCCNKIQNGSKRLSSHNAYLADNLTTFPKSFSATPMQHVCIAVHETVEYSRQALKSALDRFRKYVHVFHTSIKMGIGLRYVAAPLLMQLS